MVVVVEEQDEDELAGWEWHSVAGLPVTVFLHVAADDARSRPQRRHNGLGQPPGVFAQPEACNLSKDTCIPSYGKIDKNI